MKQVDAKRDIIQEWRSLPKDQRQTGEQAAAFAMLIKDKYKFSGSADPYQTIKGWLQTYLSLTRGVTKSAPVTIKKKRGRPPAGSGTQVGERWHPAELAAIDVWIASSTDKTITRAHAIRRLVALGLKAKK